MVPGNGGDDDGDVCASDDDNGDRNVCCPISRFICMENQHIADHSVVYEQRTNTVVITACNRHDWDEEEEDNSIHSISG